MKKEDCDCIIAYELGFSHIDDGVWIEQIRKSYTKNRHKYDTLSYQTKFCPECGKRIKVSDNKRKLWD